jgi:hypothetical protein
VVLVSLLVLEALVVLDCEFHYIFQLVD